MHLKRTLQPSTIQIISLILIVTGVGSAIVEINFERGNFDDMIQLMYESAIHNEELIREESFSFTWSKRFMNSVLAILILLLSKELYQSRIYLTIGISNLLKSLILFIVFNYALGSIFGNYPGAPKIYFISCLIVLILLTLAKGPSPEKLIILYKYISGFMLLSSIFWGVFFPDTANSLFLEASVEAKRLQGVFNHPREIGIYALILFAIETKIQTKGWWLHSFILIIAIVALVMSISKTAIIWTSIFLYWHLISKSILHAIVINTITFISILIILQLFPDIFTSVLNNNSELENFTGRDVIWATILDNLATNPIFGNGPAYFYGSSPISVPHAHNVFLQSFSDGGLFGLFGLFGYLFALFYLGFKNNSASKSLSTILILLLLLFSMTETIMRIDDFFNGSFFINAFIIVYLCALDRQRLNK